MAGTTGSAITVAADSVTVDLNGHAIRSNAAANIQTVGVDVRGQKYFTVTDGTIAGFSRGVAVVIDGTTRSKGGLISDLKVQRSHFYGLLIDCDGCVVRDNMITDTDAAAGFTTIHPDGIAVEGNANLVTGNRVYGVHPQSGSTGSLLAIGANASTVSNNYLANDAIGSNAVYGIIVSGQNTMTLANQVHNATYCYYLQGVVNKYRDNVAGGCTTAYAGASSGGADDLGGNQ